MLFKIKEKVWKNIFVGKNFLRKLRIKKKYINLRQIFAASKN